MSTNKVYVTKKTVKKSPVKKKTIMVRKKATPTKKKK